MDPVSGRFSRRRVLTSGLIAAGALAAGGLGIRAVVAAPAGPVTWQVSAGIDQHSRGIDVIAFLPQALTINAGDTVVWTVPTMAPHTVTFVLADPPTDAQPWPGIGENILASGSPVTGPINGGSDLLETGATYQLTFDAPGHYHYVCLIHSGPNDTLMRGDIEVQPAGTARVLTGQANPQSVLRRAVQAALQGGYLLERQAREMGGRRDAEGRRVVVAGIDNGVDTAIFRFFPQTLHVRKGETVHFVNVSGLVPHTVTFGEVPEDIFPPSGDDPLDFPGPTGNLHSGFLAVFSPFGTTFDVRFTTVGTYPYICVPHAEMGMVGTIVVTP